jgi:hypothetical protein
VLVELSSAQSTNCAVQLLEPAADGASHSPAKECGDQKYPKPDRQQCHDRPVSRLFDLFEFLSLLLGHQFVDIAHQRLRKSGEHGITAL